jgi:hypothetical protein
MNEEIVEKWTITNVMLSKTCMEGTTDIQILKTITAHAQ